MLREWLSISGSVRLLPKTTTRGGGTMQTRSSMIQRLSLVMLVGILGLLPSPTFAVPKDVFIKSAVYNAKSHQLLVTVKLRNPGRQVLLLHGDGGMLAQVDNSQASQTIHVALPQLGQIPCSIEARSGEASAVRTVRGAPAECRKRPVCKIITPAEGAVLSVNESFEFEAEAKSRDKTAKDLIYEWNFSGGVMGIPTDDDLTSTVQSPKDLSGSARFVRDNSYYRIRFTAVDAHRRFCESAVTVKVGNPPSDAADFPPPVGEQPTPLRGSENNGAEEDWVVLPFQQWTMQHSSDMKTAPNGQISFNGAVTSIDAQVIRKGSVGAQDKPVFLTSEQADVWYSAASNPLDPAGAGSINSTSQNWPLNADPTKPQPLLTAAVKKSDWWEKLERPAGPTVWSHYSSWAYIQSPYYSPYAYTYMVQESGQPHLDEGFGLQMQEPQRGDFDFKDTQPGLTGADLAAYEQSIFDYVKGSYDATKTLLAGVNPDHGRYMPGKTGPYAANEPQAFSLFQPADNWFAANMIPITDIDDKGQVNPLPLLRVEARVKGTDQVRGAADVVLANSRDFHCRECHAKGKIAANPEAKYTRQAFHSSPWGQGTDSGGGHDHGGSHTPLDKPEFYAAESDSLFDQEYAAALNYSSLHDFYDAFGFHDAMLNGIVENGLVTADTPQPCAGCHLSVTQMVHSGELWWNTDEYDYDNYNYDPNWSMAIHRFHAELQYNPQRDDIVRDDKGAFARWKWFDESNQPRPHNTVASNTLFPVFDDQGQQLPMEQNCLRCHAGEREQCYRDRMYTAGVTCYDCHGDMAAVGQAFKKPAELQSGDGNAYRIPWFDETDCGSCHRGNGNLGKDSGADFFSAGVLRRAFAADDPSATPFRPNLADPDDARFAVVPEQGWEYPLSISRCPTGSRNYDNCSFDTGTQRISARLFRAGKDQHAAVACSACHGAAHGITPNQDPRSNDNVAAIQLQGYPGQLFECGICHTQGSFNTEDASGSTLHYPDKNGKPTILAGPHNLHPINDPDWYLNERTGETAQPNQTDGTTKGGWHSAWSGKPGLKGEDQCAACHGDDHLGTRLSKVPVDRVYDFSGFKMKKLKKAGFKSKIVKVKAGTPIGCNTCHDLKTSRLQSPEGPITPRHAPVIATEPVLAFVIGENFAYSVTATDADQNIASYSLDRGPDGMAVDSQGHVTWTHAPADPSETVSFLVTVTDSAGLSASRWFSAKAACPSVAPNWDAVLAQCSPLQISSVPPVGGIKQGETFSYPLSANLPATFAVVDGATGQAPTFTPAIAVDAGGLLTWTPDATSPDSVSFRILATAKDDLNHQAGQDMTLAVCRGTQDWHAGMAMCMNNTLPQITSSPAPKGLSAAATYSYDVNATDADQDTLSYSLTEHPDGMVIDAATGIITWKAAAASSGPVNFTVRVDDGFGTVTQAGTVTVCVSPQHWDTGMQMCM
ncbi:MAG: cytochrome C [Methylococcaceae bacterium]|nr:cytochrome C [Methylococcaceae bacterium]